MQTELVVNLAIIQNIGKIISIFKLVLKTINNNNLKLK